MKKRIILLFILAISIITLVGCAKKNERSNVNNYISKEIGISDFELANEAVEKKDDEGYTDYYWHVKYKNIEFDVVDNYKYVGENLTNSLESDFDIKVIEYYLSKYKNKSSIILGHDDIYDQEVLFCEAGTYQGEIDDTKLRTCYNNLVDLFKTIDLKTYPISYIPIKVTNGTKHIKWLQFYKNNHLNSYNEFRES